MTNTLVSIANLEPSIYDRSCRARSAWERGVAKYALDLLSDLASRGIREIPMERNTRSMFLNGASNWHDYSLHGNALICDFEIAERLNTPKEIMRRYRGHPEGKRPCALDETWIDAQARALAQAYDLIMQTARTHHFSAIAS